jgi:uncharacterized protein YecA (UPF0149 family)
MTMSGGGDPAPKPVASPRHRAAAAGGRAEAPRAGRNEPCPCGSGKKFKKCHGA